MAIKTNIDFSGDKTGKVSLRVNDLLASGNVEEILLLVEEMLPKMAKGNDLWMQRALGMFRAVMPLITYRRDSNRFIPTVATITDIMSLPEIVAFSRNASIPQNLRQPLLDHLKALELYKESYFDETGQEIYPDKEVYTSLYHEHGYLILLLQRELNRLDDLAANGSVQ